MADRPARLMMETKSTAIIQVDDREVQATEGDNLLLACLSNGIYIPNLCFIAERTRPQASCRLCFVEIAGVAQPVTSCTEVVHNGMVLYTDTPRVRQLQRSGLRLLLSAHHVDCKNCPANKRCALQDMAKRLKVRLKSKTLEQWLKTPDIDRRHPNLDYYPNRCVLCGKCLHACQQAGGEHSLTFANRGFDTVVSYFGGEGGTAKNCLACQACVDICPVAALLLRSDHDARDNGKTPTTRASK